MRLVSITSAASRGVELNTGGALVRAPWEIKDTYGTGQKLWDTPYIGFLCVLCETKARIQATTISPFFY